MLLRRVIPCLDVDKGRVVKGVEFVNLRDAGDPVELAEVFGAQCVVLAIDARREDGGYGVYVDGGRRPVGRDAIAWAREGVERGAGEILLTSMDRDGTGAGYDTELVAAVAQAVSVPVIASGGAGTLEQLPPAIEAGADALLCASIFHYGRHTVAEVKQHLARHGVAVRAVDSDTNPLTRRR